MSSAESGISALQTGKQDKLTAGAGIDITDNVITGRDFTANPIQSNEIAVQAVTDQSIGERAVSDQNEAATLVAVTGKNLTTWLQGIRNNLKYLFRMVSETSAALLNKMDGDRTVTINGVTKNVAENPSFTVSGGGGGGTDDHAALTNLDYESSGHTGFATSAQGALAETNATAISIIKVNLTTVSAKIGAIEEDMATQSGANTFTGENEFKASIDIELTADGAIITNGQQAVVSVSDENTKLHINQNGEYETVDISNLTTGEKAVATENYVDGAVDTHDQDPQAHEALLNEILATIPAGGLRVPVETDLESELPDPTTLEVGDYFFVQDMDVTAEGKTGRAWVNYTDPSDTNTPLRFYKVFDQYYSADGETIDLNAYGAMQVKAGSIGAAQLDEDTNASLQKAEGALPENGTAQNSLALGGLAAANYALKESTLTYIHNNAPSDPTSLLNTLASLANEIGQNKAFLASYGTATSPLSFADMPPTFTGNLILYALVSRGIGTASVKVWSNWQPFGTYERELANIPTTPNWNNNWQQTATQDWVASNAVINYGYFALSDPTSLMNSIISLGLPTYTKRVGYVVSGQTGQLTDVPSEFIGGAFFIEISYGSSNILIVRLTLSNDTAQVTRRLQYETPAWYGQWKYRATQDWVAANALPKSGGAMTGGISFAADTGFNVYTTDQIGVEGGFYGEDGGISFKSERSNAGIIIWDNEDTPMTIYTLSGILALDRYWGGIGQDNPVNLTGVADPRNGEPLDAVNQRTLASVMPISGQTTLNATAGTVASKIPAVSGHLTPGRTLTITAWGSATAGFDLLDGAGALIQANIARVDMLFTPTSPVHYFATLQNGTTARYYSANGTPQIRAANGTGTSSITYQLF
jgi:hypothetical protein